MAGGRPGGARWGEPPSEAWQALAEKGFVGVNIPRDWGGGGLGMSGLAIVGEEVAAAGVPTLMLVVSSAIGGGCPRLRRHHAHARPADRDQARRRSLPAERPESVHLRGRGGDRGTGDRADARFRRSARN